MSHHKIVRTGLLAAGLSVALGASAASAQDFNPFAFLFGGSQPAQEGRSAYAPQAAPSYERGNLPGYGSPSGHNRRYRLREEGTLDPSDPRLQRAIKHQREFARPKPVRNATVAKAVAEPAPSHKISLAHRGAPTHDAESAPISAPSHSLGKAQPVSPTKDAPQGSLALFMKDKTLRAGDVVVTNDGFMVYKGGASTPTKASFVALNGARGISGERNTLLALERVSRQSTPSNVTVETVAMKETMGPNLPEQDAKPAASGKIAKAQ